MIKGRSEIKLDSSSDCNFCIIHSNSKSSFKSSHSSDPDVAQTKKNKIKK